MLQRHSSDLKDLHFLVFVPVNSFHLSFRVVDVANRGVEGPSLPDFLLIPPPGTPLPQPDARASTPSKPDNHERRVALFLLRWCVWFRCSRITPSPNDSPLNHNCTCSALCRLLRALCHGKWNTQGREEDASVIFTLRHMSTDTSTRALSRETWRSGPAAADAFGRRSPAFSLAPRLAASVALCASAKVSRVRMQIVDRSFDKLCPDS